MAVSQVLGDWKKRNITPFSQKGRKKDVGNYRPVSFMSVLTKKDHGTNPPGRDVKAQGGSDTAT